jgi:hypothetical protein
VSEAEIIAAARKVLEHTGWHGSLAIEQAIDLAERAIKERDEARTDWARLTEAQLSPVGCACGKYPDLGDGVGMRDGHGDKIAHTRPGYGATCETVVYKLRMLRSEGAHEALRAKGEALARSLDAGHLAHGHLAHGEACIGCELVRTALAAWRAK